MGFKRLSRLNKSGFDRLKANKINMPQLKIGDSVATVPIVQGGMGVGISLSGLASAVANAGGIGVIAANAIGMLEPDYFTNGKEANKRALRKQIQIARRQSAGVIGVNIMVAVNDFHELLQVAIDERIDLVFMGAGLPLKGIPVQELRAAKVKAVPIVSSARAAKLIFSYWQKHYDTVPDAVVVEGPKAGGHLGFKIDDIDNPAFSLECIIPSVVETIKSFEEKLNKTIPVIAAGGIYDGEDIYKFFDLGASGVQMATRFVATHECDADRRFKEAYVNCEEKDVVLIKSPVGLPGRAIHNSFLSEVESGKRKIVRCPWRCLESCKAKDAKYCISEALDNARKGDLQNGYAFAGSNAYRIESIVHVKTLVKQLKKEYFLKVENSTVTLRSEFDEAIRKLAAFRDQYARTVKKNFKSFKTDLEQMLDKSAATCRDEYKKALIRLEHLNEEYAKHLDKVNRLKEQLSQYLDTSGLKLPTISMA
jgi:nitronate monooxygenase